MLVPLCAAGSAVVALVIAAVGAYVLGRKVESKAARARCVSAEVASARLAETAARERSESELRHRAQLAATQQDLGRAEARLAEVSGRFARLRTQTRQTDVQAAAERRREEAALQARDRALLAAVVERQRLEEALAQTVAARMEEERRNALLLAATRRVGAGGDPAALRSEAAELAARQLRVSLWGLFELDATGQVLRPSAGGGWKEGRLERATLAARGDGLGRYVLDAKEPVVVDGLLRDRRFIAPPVLVEHGVVSAVLVPVAGARGAAGLMGFFSTEQRRFCSSDVSFAAGVGALLDLVSERERASEAIRDERARATAVESASLDAVVFLDDLGRVVSANDAAGAMFRCPPERLRTRVVGDLLGASSDAELEVTRAVQMSLREGLDVHGRASGRRSDGSLFPAQVAIAQASAQRGPRLVAVIRDLGLAGRAVWPQQPSWPNHFTIARSGVPLAARQVAIAAPRRGNLTLTRSSGTGAAAP